MYDKFAQWTDSGGEPECPDLRYNTAPLAHYVGTYEVYLAGLRGAGAAIREPAVVRAASACGMGAN